MITSLFKNKVENRKMQFLCYFNCIKKIYIIKMPRRNEIYSSFSLLFSHYRPRNCAIFHAQLMEEFFFFFCWQPHSFPFSHFALPICACYIYFFIKAYQSVNMSSVWHISLLVGWEWKKELMLMIHEKKK